MKKSIGIGLATIVALFGLSGAALAATKHTKNITLAKTQTVNDDYFAAGDTVDIAGTVNGDVYAAGGQVTIEGTVNGDVIAAGGTITVSGDINGNLRAAGGQINLSGKVAHNITLGGGTVDISKTAEIDGSIVAGSGTIRLAGVTKGNVRLGGGTVNVSGKVSGNILAGVSQLTVASGTEVGGNVKYWSDQAAEVASDAKITGTITQIQPPARKTSVTKRIGLWSRLYWLGAVLIAGFLLLILLPNFTREVVGVIEKRFWPSLGIGLLGLIVTPIVAILLMVTIIGIPFGMLLGIIYAAGLALSSVWVALVVGDLVAKFFKVTNSAYLVLVLGAVSYGILLLIPVVSGIAGFLGLLAGLGGSWLAVHRLYGRLRQTKQI